MSISPYDEGMIAGSGDGSVDDNPYGEGSDAHSEWERGFQEASYANGPGTFSAGLEEALDTSQAIRDQVRDNLKNNRYPTEKLRALAAEMEELLTQSLRQEGRE